MAQIQRLSRFLLPGLAALFLFGGPARAEPPAAPADAQSVRGQIDDAPSRGLFYEVTAGKATLYLFGTIHVGKPEFYPLSQSVIDAVVNSQYLAVEADITDEAANAKLIAETALYPAADSLERHISPELMQRLRVLLEKYNFPLEQAQKLKPWMLALTLDYIGTDSAGFSPQYGADLFLLGLAKGMKKPIAELESMQFQIHLFDSMTAAEQEEYLASTAEVLESGEFDTELNELVEAWGKADSRGIQKAIEDGEAAVPASAQWFITRLIKDRNASMTARIEEFLRSGKQYFVAVGAGHIVGGDGIVARLKAKGYKVRDLQ